MQPNPIRHRDDGLKRVSAITRWVAGASAAAAGLFAIAAAHPKVPHISPATSGPAANPADSGVSGDDGGSSLNDSGGNLSAPSHPPARAVSRPQVVSGSS